MAKRNQVPALVALIDIDEFEMITVSYGMSTGERIVELTVELVMQRCRSGDLIACVGEGKIGLIFYDITSVNAKNTLESIREKITMNEYLIGDEKKKITVSIGGTIMHSRTNAGALDTLYEQAIMAIKAVRKRVVVVLWYIRCALSNKISSFLLNPKYALEIIHLLQSISTWAFTKNHALSLYRI